MCAFGFKFAKSAKMTTPPQKKKLFDTGIEKPVVRIRIHRIHMFLGLLDPDPDPLVRGMDPDPALDSDPSIVK